MSRFRGSSLLDRISAAVDGSKGRFVRVLSGVFAGLIFYGLCGTWSGKAVARGDLASAGFNLGVGLVVLLFALASAAWYFVYLIRQGTKR
jgi:hypothetical protein